MSVVITGKVATATSAGGFIGQDQKRVYLRPSRNDFQFSLDSGVIWHTWEGDPDLSETYPGAIAATTDVNGNFAFTVPWSDDPNETALPDGSPVPDLEWNIIDPNPTAGPLVYHGPTRAAIVAATKTLKELIKLSTPDTWQVDNVSYSAAASATERFGTATFTSAGVNGSILFPTIGTTSWTFTYGVESDDEKQYTVTLDSTNKTDTGAPIKLSDLPEFGKTVLVHFHVRAS